MSNDASAMVDPSHLNDYASANSTPMGAEEEESAEISSRLEIEAGIHREFVESTSRMDLYGQWKALNVSSQNAKSMSGLDWMSFMFYNAPVGEVVDELFEFFDAYLLQPMHGRWLKAGSLWRRLPPNVVKDAMDAGVADYAKLPSRMYLIGAYVDAFHPGESVSRIAMSEEDLALIRGSAEEVVSVFETLVEHMGAGRVPSSDMVGHFPSLLMSYAVTSVRMRIRHSGSGVSVAKDRASAEAARDWYIVCLEAAAAEAMRRAAAGGGPGTPRDVARRLGEEWRSVATVLKSYRAMLAGVAGGSRVVPARSVSILPYVPLPAYALNPQRLVYEAVVVRGMRPSERKRGREGGGNDDEEGGVLGAGEAGMVLLPNPIMDEWDRKARRGARDEDDDAEMSIDEARSRLGPNSLVASRRAFLLFRDAYWARIEAVGAGDAARRGAGEGGEGGDEDEDDEDEEENPEDTRARMSDGAKAARVLKDLVCVLKEVLLTQGGNYSFSRLSEDKGLERLQEVVHVGLTGRTLPGCTWDSAVAVVRCMFRYLMFKCSLLSPAQVLELHRGRELRMCMLEKYGEDGMEEEDDEDHSVARGRRKAILDALRFLVETVQRIRWDSDNERVVRLSPLLERCAVYVLRKGVARGISREAQRRRRGHDGRIKCHICEPAGGNDGLGRLRAFVASVCRDDPDHILATPAAARVRVCVVRGVVRKLLGCFVPGVGPFSWDRYDADANVLATIPEGYDECSACVTRRMGGDFWLPEPLAVFDDARLRRLRRRFEFVVRMEAILSASVRIFRQSFHRSEMQFELRFNEAMRVLLGHMRRVVAAERERRWGAWSEIEMRAVLHAAVQFRSGAGSSMSVEAREMDEIIVNMIMERSSPYQILHETMQLRRAINAERLTMAETRCWDVREAKEEGQGEDGVDEGDAQKNGAKRARTASGAAASEPPSTPPTHLSDRIGLRRATFSATELSLHHDECELLCQTWTEVLQEIAVVSDLTMEVSGEYYKTALDGVFRRNPGLRAWLRPGDAGSA